LVHGRLEFTTASLILVMRKTFTTMCLQEYLQDPSIQLVWFFVPMELIRRALNGCQVSSTTLLLPLLYGKSGLLVHFRALGLRQASLTMHLCWSLLMKLSLLNHGSALDLSVPPMLKTAITWSITKQILTRMKSNTLPKPQLPSLVSSLTKSSVVINIWTAALLLAWTLVQPSTSALLSSAVISQKSQLTSWLVLISILLSLRKKTAMMP